MAIADLSVQEIAELRAVLAEWQAQKQQEAHNTIGSIDREIAQPLQDVNPRLQKQERLATEEGQLKGLLPHLPDADKQQAEEAIARSEQARADLDQTVQPIRR